jgi:hypothetical protein
MEPACVHEAHQLNHEDTYVFVFYMRDGVLFSMCESVTSGFDFLFHDSKGTGEGRGEETPSGQTQSNRTCRGYDI